MLEKIKIDLSFINRLTEYEDIHRAYLNACHKIIIYGRDSEIGRISEKAKIALLNRWLYLNSIESSYKTLIEQDCYTALKAYEWVLSVKNGKRTYARRVRSMIERYGIVEALARAVRKGEKSYGLNILIDHNMKDYAFENVILKHTDAFDINTATIAQETLDKINLHEK